MSVPLLAYPRVFCVLALVWIGRLPIARDHLDVVCKSVVTPWPRLVSPLTPGQAIF